MNFFGGMNLFPIFSNFIPEWLCASIPMSKDCDSYNLCHINQETVTFTHLSFHSTAYKLKWFCDDTKFPTISNQVQLFGYFFGTLLFGFASDVLGRKLIAAFAVGLGITATVVSALLHSTYLIFAARFCIGLAIGGQMVVECTFIMEMLLPEQRMFARAYFNWGISRMLLTTICYFTQEWRAACFGIALCCMPALLACLFIFPESPTWLLSKGRLEEMRESEKKIARIAGVQYVPINHPIPEKPKLLIAVMRSGLWKRLIVLWAMWFTASTCSYATDLASSRLSGNLYLNQFLFGLVIYVSKVILGIVDSRFPAFSRRVLHQGSQFFAVACFGALAICKLVGYNGVMMLILNILGIVFVEYTWDACYLCAIEGVETSSRAFATGSSSFIARIGMLLSPSLSHIDKNLPGTVYIVVVVLGSLNLLQSYLFLVETKGVKLDEVTVDGHEVKHEGDAELEQLKK
ncbi:hypothetical protein PENTCL1PPCAC_3926 [Pristionchus entomophagus]|uniref:Major facilitator superfamily (MFS) profile domain-containing protein n=1 Tax=Pristionchus entomophagus TaxID=358040 RepID=A0AAV5SEH7_9BILA|nr:hypothetical protein PENTCL1PPCAC_3926 [Pristionchus entomophagus]